MTAIDEERTKHIDRMLERERRADAYPRLVEALAFYAGRHDTISSTARALLAELGETP